MKIKRVKDNSIESKVRKYPTRTLISTLPKKLHDSFIDTNNSLDLNFANQNNIHSRFVLPDKATVYAPNTPKLPTSYPIFNHYTCAIQSSIQPPIL